MSLSPGTRLGPYEIEAPIGASGMGEVYKARVLRSAAPPRSASRLDLGRLRRLRRLPPKAN